MAGSQGSGPPNALHYTSFQRGGAKTKNLGRGVGKSNENEKTSAGKVEKDLHGKGIVWRERITIIANANLSDDVWKLLEAVKVFLDGFF